MATHRTDVSVRFGVPDALQSAVGAAQLPLVHVPDVRLRAEATAIAEIAAAGLVPGHRDPRPRPVNGRPEVVIRTHPRHGALVRRGTRIDYEVAPGRPRGAEVPVPGYGDDVAAPTTSAASTLPRAPRPMATTRVAADGYVDFDATETVRGASLDLTAASSEDAPQRYVDFDVIDTLLWSGRRPIAGRA